MGDILHDRIGAPAFDEGAQLVLEILRLLPRQPRHRKPSAIALRRQAVAGFAVLELGLEASSFRPHDIMRMPRRCEQRRNQHHHRQGQTRYFHTSLLRPTIWPFGTRSDITNLATRRENSHRPSPPE